VFDELRHDLRYAVRTLARSPAFTAVAVLMLALGIGANTAIFSLFSAVLLRPLPFPDPDRLVLVWDDLSARRGPRTVEPTAADYSAWRAQSRSFVDMAAFVTSTYVLTRSGEPDSLAGIRTTANLFSVLGIRPLIGRTLTPADDAADAPPMVVFADSVWRSRFGGDPGLIGRTVVLNGLAHTVVGVVPDDFRFPNALTVLYVPAKFTPAELADRGSYSYDVVARLRPDATLTAAQAEMTTIARRLAAASPATNDGVGIAVTPLHEHLTGDRRPALAVLLAAVAVVLLIACANLANLLLVRGAMRRRELAVRKALGARPRRLVRQLITESAVLAGAGAVLGTAMATLVFAYLTRLVPGALPADTSPTLDVRVLAFVVGVAVLVVVAVGSGPAIAASRVGPGAALKTAARGSVGGGRMVRRVLVIAEVALTVVLLIAAGLLLRSYAGVLAVDPGFDAGHVLIAETVLPPSTYAALDRRSAFYDAVIERVAALPGVIAAGYVNYPPLVFKGGRVFVSIEGRAAPPPTEFSRFIISDRVASAGYFTALAVPVIRGRVFDRRDGPAAPLALVINDAMARRHWPGEDPLGRRIKIGRLDGPNPWLTIVGVVGNVRQMGLDAAPEPEIYFAASQTAAAMAFFWPRHLVVRAAGEPVALATGVRKAVAAVDPDQPVSSIRSMSQVVDAELRSRNTQLTLVAGFAVLALVMATVGVYGVLSFSVTQRLPEIGVRMALGAQPFTVVSDIVRDALTMTGVGVAIGLGAAVAVTRILRTWLFEISPVDPATYVATALLLALTTLVASWLPAARGAGVDPSAVLRSE
jgi:predicted permease